MPDTPKADGLSRAAAVIVLALALLSWRPVTADDAFMYAATGRYVVDHREVPRTDPLSWTAAGQPWQSNGWLWGVVAWGAYDVAGSAGLALLNPVLVLAIGAAAAFAATGVGARRNGSLVAAVAASGAAIFFAEPRPHLASYASFALAIGCAARALAPSLPSSAPPAPPSPGAAARPRPHSTVRDRAFWTVATFGVMVVWANVHSVAPFGVVAVGVLAAGAAARGLAVARVDRGRGLAAVGHAVVLVAVAGIAVVVTPFGAEPLRHASEVRASSQTTITEWFPLWRLQPTDIQVVLFLIGVATSVAVVRRFGGLRARPELVGLLALFGALAVDANRNVAFFLLAVAVAAPALAGVAAVRAVSSRPVPVAADRVRMLGVAALGLLGASTVITMTGLRTITQPAASLPVALVDGLPSGCRLLNDRHVGGFVLLRRPDVPVSADGRNDLYGVEGFAVQTAWFQPESTGGSLAALDRDGITCMLFTAPSQATEVMARAPGWTRLDAGGPGMAFLRTIPLGA